MQIHSIGPEIIILTAGSIVYTIKRAADENLTLWLYAEWESPKDLAEHLKSPYLKEHLKTNKPFSGKTPKSLLSNDNWTPYLRIG